MHIWILTQYYPPEVGAASVRLSRLAYLLASDGHQITTLTGMPNYPTGIIPPQYRKKFAFNETVDSVSVRRVWVYASPSKSTYARLLNQITFMVTAALQGLFLKRPDVILVESHPLFVCLASGWLRLWKRAPIVLNVSDLWPESAVATGALRADSMLVKVASWVEHWAYWDAAHIVGMTEGVVAGILKVHPHPERVTLIHNAVDLDKFRPNLTMGGTVLRQRLGVDGRFLVLHVGNMSLTYDFDIMLDAAEALPDLFFVFVGGGSQELYIREQVSARKLHNILFAGVLPHDDMPAVWSAADVCLIGLRDHAVAGGTRPAKMYEALATGTPIVAAIRGEGATLLEKSQAGIVVPIGDRAAMINALRELAASPQKRTQMAANARRFAEQHFSANQCKSAYFDIFRRVTHQETL